MTVKRPEGPALCRGEGAEGDGDPSGRGSGGPGRRVCALDGCDEAFEPARPSQKYHAPACRKEAWRMRRRRDLAEKIAAELEDELMAAFAQAIERVLAEHLVRPIRETLEREL